MATKYVGYTNKKDNKVLYKVNNHDYSDTSPTKYTSDRVSLQNLSNSAGANPFNTSLEEFSRNTVGDEAYQAGLAAYGLPNDAGSYQKNSLISGSSSSSKTYTPATTGDKPSFNWSGVKPTYSSSYSSQIQGLLNQILNKEKFSYNYTSDPLYEQYRDVYTREGNLAMRDAMGSSAALTGGYGNSYGTTAASQANQQYMGKLSAVIPQLEQLAYQKYQDEVADRYNQMNVLNTLENNEYNRYRDDVSDYYQDYSNAYNEYAGKLSQYNYENEQKTAKDQWNTQWAYQQQDALDRTQAAKELAYKYAAAGLAYPYSDLEGLYSGSLYNPVKASGSSGSGTGKTGRKRSGGSSKNGYSSKASNEYKGAAASQLAPMLSTYKKQGKSNVYLANIVEGAVNKGNITGGQAVDLAKQFGFQNELYKKSQTTSGKKTPILGGNRRTEK